MSSWFGLTPKTSLPKVDPPKTPLPKEDSSENANFLKTATKVLDKLMELDKDDDALLMVISQNQKTRKEQAEQQAREAEMVFEMQRSKMKRECYWAYWAFSATLFELNCHAVASNNLFGFPRPRDFAWNC